MNETRTLARFVVESHWNGIPETVRHEAKRALLNWLGCALGGCRDETVERTVATLRATSGPPAATLIGRPEKLDVLSAALVNAISSNILDFDDTHMTTVIHPTVPVAAAVLALSQHREVSGDRLLHALVLGIEAECRIGKAVSLEHYEKGWHITATCGVFGAAAAAGKLLDLDERQMNGALGIAATQSSGLTAMLGSMCKSYNMGHAAKSGVTAALLASRNFTSSERALEAPRGFGNVLGGAARWTAITEALGGTWELAWNAYKPYPCGIVLHAAIDGCLDLRQEYALTSRDVRRVEIRMHPLGLQLAGKPAPTTGLEGKLSVYHAAAVALAYGKAGVLEFTDECVNGPEVTALRQRIVANSDAALDKAAAHVRIELSNGSTIERDVPHARGSLERPLSDGDIERKFRTLAEPVCSERQASEIVECVASLETLKNAAVVMTAAAAHH